MLQNKSSHKRGIVKLFVEYPNNIMTWQRWLLSFFVTPLEFVKEITRPRAENEEFSYETDQSGAFIGGSVRPYTPPHTQFDTWNKWNQLEDSCQKILIGVHGTEQEMLNKPTGAKKKKK